MSGRGSRCLLSADRFEELLHALRARGYACVGPTLRDGAIVYDRIDGCGDLPRGWTDIQGPGTYRLERRDDDAFFGYAVGPHTFKKFVFPPERRLWQLKRHGQGYERIDEAEEAPRYAFIGVRGCEVAALRIQDRVFTGGDFVEPEYERRRRGAFVVAVDCTQSADTCFCASMNTGPEVESGYDLALTELVGDRHTFVIRAGSDRGEEVLEALECEPAQEVDLTTAGERIEQAARSQSREIDASDVRELLMRNLESDQWQEVAKRCLACANCTMVCPTCFCSSIEDTTDLTGEHAERWRRWDSCFNPDFSYLYGGEVRQSTASRYRQWMTHKLATWHDQFGSSGCVGCGRCISWCPVGIDITEEVRKMREDESS